jgi:hypothetical protein
MTTTGNAVFPWGHDAWVFAAQYAAACTLFQTDVEEELIADDDVSCYNCRYRRWTAASFTCLATEGCRNTIPEFSRMAATPG